MKKTKIAIIGSNGLVGTVLVNHFKNHQNYEVACCVDVNEPDEMIVESGAEVAVVFAKGISTIERIKYCLLHGIHVINGTTGLNFQEIEDLQKENQSGACFFTASNFAFKSVLAIDATVKIAKYSELSDIIITEYHRAGKFDKPSGTAKTTATEILKSKGIDISKVSLIMVNEELDIIDFEISDKPINRYTYDFGGITIIAIRSDEYVARQTVSIGGADSFFYEHDAPSRTSYMPGVELAIQHVLNRYDRYTEGLINIL